MPTKLQHQQRRAMSIVGAIDSGLLRDGIDVIDQSGKIALVLLGWSEADWSNIAVAAKLETAPSTETRALVIRQFFLRAKAPIQQAVIQ